MDSRTPYKLLFTIKHLFSFSVVKTIRRILKKALLEGKPNWDEVELQEISTFIAHTDLHANGYYSSPLSIVTKSSEGKQAAMEKTLVFLYDLNPNAGRKKQRNNQNTSSLSKKSSTSSAIPRSIQHSSSMREAGSTSSLERRPIVKRTGIPAIVKNPSLVTLQRSEQMRP